MRKPMTVTPIDGEPAKFGVEFVRSVHDGEDGKDALRSVIAERMTAYQLRNGNAIRNLVAMYTERWLADWANRTGYRLMAHERFRASVEVSHAAIIARQR